MPLNDKRISPDPLADLGVMLDLLFWCTDLCIGHPQSSMFSELFHEPGRAASNFRSTSVGCGLAWLGDITSLINENNEVKG